MKIRHIHLYRISIPFKNPFRHSTHQRSAADNIVIETQLEDGTIGYGEGLPREYVTEETQEEVISAFKGLNPALFEINFYTPDELLNYLNLELLSQKNFKQDKQNNTARCALELSLLDAYSQVFKITFSDIAKSFLKDSSLENIAEVFYDGAISLGSFSQNLWAAFKMKLFGFKKIKIKVDENKTSALKTVKTVRAILGPKVDLRVDANGAWTLEEAYSASQALSKYGISCIEQPLPHSELMKMQDLKNASPIPLMLDESLCTLEDARLAIEKKLCDLFNIRLSKCGGFLNSLRIAQLARQNGLSYQLGCMVGETGILSAAGRHFACITPNLKYLEGSYDHFLLRDNITKEDITFGYSGKAPALHGFGLGVQVDPDKLKRYTTFQTRIF